MRGRKGVSTLTVDLLHDHRRPVAAIALSVASAVATSSIAAAAVAFVAVGNCIGKDSQKAEKGNAEGQAKHFVVFLCVRVVVVVVMRSGKFELLLMGMIAIL